MVSIYFHLFNQQWWNCLACILSDSDASVHFTLHDCNIMIADFTFNKILVFVKDQYGTGQITGLMFLYTK
jgi:hypothetical protein